uniref:DoxX family protein n=1 Tax=Craspedostauros australis TaxID=1486917 RepID=A0A7R9WSE8_9STRA|mmetsp:Transcript_18589/g.51672  ORF Transcript_18589/g.51672 Transcript_18589/m.51672 type:complete len:253 (+) Transcript_18589:157-915(+)|eukprot:CAMPEP_0198116008 /NCGR_PEP_ID=MMETSP1442-20131203/9187_1 /TAXON_ID= /ORGANISM="Craspedostauros australis, Strain CCMP3328" /LENGTH=252 /DNA_ID=CAMNT_0043773681 /DNA_START=72 /DNA_END=830 /DNA_ORIENTATION=-
MKVFGNQRNASVILAGLCLLMATSNAFVTPGNGKGATFVSSPQQRPSSFLKKNIHDSANQRSDGVNLHLSDDGKETTWDRITGPKLFKTVTNWQGIHSVPLVPLRILTGLLMIHHGSEGGVGPANFGTPEFQGFIDYIITPYFGFLPGPPELWSAIHDYVEFFGGALFAIGFLTRPAALSLFVTMLSAVYFHLSAAGAQGFPLGHVANYSYDFEEPLLYALIFLMFWFNGAGPLSVDSIIYKSISNEDEDGA